LIFSLICVWLTPGIWYSIGIFDGDDVRLLGLHGPQRRAQRRRLSASGGADDEDHAVLMAQKLAHFLERGG